MCTCIYKKLNWQASAALNHSLSDKNFNDYLLKQHKTCTCSAYLCVTRGKTCSAKFSNMDYAVHSYFETLIKGYNPLTTRANQHQVRQWYSIVHPTELNICEYNELGNFYLSHSEWDCCQGQVSQHISIQIQTYVYIYIIKFPGKLLECVGAFPASVNIHRAPVCVCVCMCV